MRAIYCKLSASNLDAETELTHLNLAAIARRQTPERGRHASRVLWLNRGLQFHYTMQWWPTLLGPFWSGKKARESERWKIFSSLWSCSCALCAGQNGSAPAAGSQWAGRQQWWNNQFVVTTRRVPLVGAQALAHRRTRGRLHAALRDRQLVSDKLGARLSLGGKLGPPGDAAPESIVIESLARSLNLLCAHLRAGRAVRACRRASNAR